MESQHWGQTILGHSSIAVTRNWNTLGNKDGHFGNTDWWSVDQSAGDLDLETDVVRVVNGSRRVGAAERGGQTRDINSPELVVIKAAEGSEQFSRGTIFRTRVAFTGINEGLREFNDITSSNVTNVSPGDFVDGAARSSTDRFNADIPGRGRTTQSTRHQSESTVTIVTTANTAVRGQVSRNQNAVNKDVSVGHIVTTVDFNARGVKASAHISLTRNRGRAEVDVDGLVDVEEGDLGNGGNTANIDAAELELLHTTKVVSHVVDGVLRQGVRSLSPQLQVKSDGSDTTVVIEGGVGGGSTRLARPDTAERQVVGGFTNIATRDGTSARQRRITQRCEDLAQSGNVRAFALAIRVRSQRSVRSVDSVVVDIQLVQLLVTSRLDDVVDSVVNQIGRISSEGVVHQVIILR